MEKLKKKKKKEKEKWLLPVPPGGVNHALNSWGRKHTQMCRSTSSFVMLVLPPSVCVCLRVMVVGLNAHASGCSYSVGGTRGSFQWKREKKKQHGFVSLSLCSPTFFCLSSSSCLSSCLLLLQAVHSHSALDLAFALRTHIHTPSLTHAS